ncbi:hypothetical protein QTQ03_12520 [Micromonospora sp. WMMA1363]|uniref:hypothetical protein n=1 Tax=Micromonospora sp. WMMA1363 TaxID=3053985 RepID=UPI00259C7080|nr:hypothetical protein [Micromonospora sp. WMMA1363]MDM4720357.1 hypothetical protein [Micromonospora sp. WMMA1363]
MNLLLILCPIAVITVFALVWALCESAAVKAYTDGRRDLHTGRLDTDRCRTDINYTDGAASEYLHTRGAR